MRVKLLGLQIGTYTKDDTYDSYMKKQYDLLEKGVKAEKPYLAVFPEGQTGPYFCTTYDDRWFKLAEFIDGPTTTTMLKKSKEMHIHIVFTFFEKSVKRDHIHYYSSMALASPTRGLVGLYRKTHLPKMETSTLTTDEKYYFEPGNSLPVFKLDNGVTVAMVLCYDRSFPEVWRAHYLQGAQIICMAACTWGFRGEFFIEELRTRAYESRSFVIALNRAGSEIVEGEKQVRDHFGKGAIINPNGDIVASIGGEPWSYVAAEVDLDLINVLSAPLPWKRDRRPELYGILTAQGCNFNEQQFLI